MGSLDDRQVNYPIAWVQVRMNGRIQPAIAVFGEPGSEPVSPGSPANRQD